MKMLLAATAITVMCGVSSVVAADYQFPSTFHPGYPNVKLEDVDQYVVLNWDDNAYSGKDATVYEPKSGTIKWDEYGRVGGKRPKNDTWSKTNNPLQLQEGDMGSAWAVKTLGAKGGNQVKQTFSFITGLFVPTFANVQQDAWKNLESELGYYTPVAEDGVEHNKIAVSWGREQSQVVNGTDIQEPWITNMAKEMLELGHEVANHTTDHFETNSPLQGGSSQFASKGFGRWNNEGFAENGELVLKCRETGEVIKSSTESKEFGSKGSATKQGWIWYAGRQISKDAWKGQVGLADELMEKYVGVSAKNKQVYGFRAPRLEINSDGLAALNELGFTYDCSIEDGWESHITDGTNIKWPFTLDNGAPNMWTQQNRGSRVWFDSLPSGMWEMPVQTMIVPENIRGQVWERANKIAQASGADIADKDWWVSKDGKITGFDFNMFILWGMTDADWLETMKYNLDQRMDGNKAPMLLGFHTDYFTPMYDNATLLADFNKDGWGLSVTQGWNSWDKRIKAVEAFVDYGLSKGAKFVSNKMLIDKMNEMSAKAVPTTGNKVSLKDLEFSYIEDEKLDKVAEPMKFKGDVTAKVSIAAPKDGTYPYGQYQSWFEAGALKKLDYIKVDYKTTMALRISLLTNGNEPARHVILNNTKTGDFVNSGYIPFHAFDFDEYEAPAKVKEFQSKTMDPANVTGIAVQPLARSNGYDYNTRKDVVTGEFSIKNFEIIGELDVDKQVATTPSTGVSKIVQPKVNGVTNGKLSLQVPATGAYSVSIVGLNGRVVHDFGSANFVSGENQLPVNLRSGIYIVRMNGKGVANLTQKLLVK